MISSKHLEHGLIDSAHEVGFRYSLDDPSLLIQHSDQGILVLLLYIDDIILTGSSDSLIQNFMATLNIEFSMKDLSPLYYFFLGVQVLRFLVDFSSIKRSMQLTDWREIPCMKRNRLTLPCCRNFDLIPILLHTRILVTLDLQLEHYSISLMGCHCFNYLLYRPSKQLYRLSSTELDLPSGKQE